MTDPVKSVPSREQRQKATSITFRCAVEGPTEQMLECRPNGSTVAVGALVVVFVSREFRSSGSAAYYSFPFCGSASAAPVVPFGVVCNLKRPARKLGEFNRSMSGKLLEADGRSPEEKFGVRSSRHHEASSVGPHSKVTSILAEIRE